MTLTNQIITLSKPAQLLEQYLYTTFGLYRVHVINIYGNCMEYFNHDKHYYTKLYTIIYQQSNAECCNVYSRNNRDPCLQSSGSSVDEAPEFQFHFVFVIYISKFGKADNNLINIKNFLKKSKFPFITDTFAHEQLMDSDPVIIPYKVTLKIRYISLYGINTESLPADFP